jgi:hypothetical protein
MHRALSVLEIVSRIVEHFDIIEGHDDYVERRKVQCALATVNRMFGELALSQIWAWVDPSTLARLMPEELWVEEYFDHDGIQCSATESRSNAEIWTRVVVCTGFK